MEILFYIMIGLFTLDIILGVIDGIIAGKRALQFDMRLWWLEQQYDKELTDGVFPEFKESNKND